VPEERSYDDTQRLWIQYENKHTITETEPLLYQLSGNKGRRRGKCSTRREGENAGQKGTREAMFV